MEKKKIMLFNLLLLLKGYIEAYTLTRPLDEKPDVKQIARSLSVPVPVNVKTRSLRRMDSTRGLIHVISMTPRSELPDCASPEDASVSENGIHVGEFNILHVFLLHLPNLARLLYLIESAEEGCFDSNTSYPAFLRHCICIYVRFTQPSPEEGFGWQHGTSRVYCNVWLSISGHETSDTD